MELTFLYILLGGFILDLVLGDPKWLPHLIVGYGNLIGKGEQLLNKGKYRFVKGMILSVLLVSASSAIPYMMLQYLRSESWVIDEIVFSIITVFYCLANKTLVKEGKAVINELSEHGIEAGRKRLSWIVGRDTSALNEQQIKKATFETMSENLSDGIIAPLFFLACFGVPGIMAYKMINTFDSMIGYKNERYEQFGKFAAILDDVVNYIPARITALLILLVKGKLNGITFVFREGKKHSSPNAGYPEAALAFVLNCQFGGPNLYGGTLVEKPFIGIHQRDLLDDEINDVAWINYAASIVFVLIVSILFLILQW